MKKNYTSYTGKELLEDEAFIRTTLEPSPETDKFWDSLTEEGIVSSEELEQARHFMDTVRKPARVMSIREKGELWKAIEIKNKETLQKKIRRQRFYLWGIAASFLLLSGLFIFHQSMDTAAVQDISQIAREWKPASAGADDQIQLIVSGEKVYQVQEKSADIVLDETGAVHVNSRLLVNETPETTKDITPQYNQLIIPKGTQSKLTLSDGSTMHINSGSRVIFPEVFGGKEREIFVDGEVFLEVTPDAEKPFIVKTHKMNVQVLGTSFNISAYEEEASQSVVLVSGSVSIYTGKNEKTLLSPNQMMMYTGEERTVSVVDVTPYISWTEGYLLCSQEEIPVLMRKLSRFYGKTIICDSALTSFAGNGKLDLKSSFEEIMVGLKELFPITIEQTDEGYYVKKRI